MIGALLLTSVLISGGGNVATRADPAGMTVVAEADGGLCLLTTGTDRGLALWDGAEFTILSDAPGAGRDVVVLGDAVLFKECPAGVPEAALSPSASRRNPGSRRMGASGSQTPVQDRSSSRFPPDPIDRIRWS